MTTYAAQSPMNIFAQQKLFAARGGFFNGLNPGIIGRIWYVKGEGTDGENIGSDSNVGNNPTYPFATIGRAIEMADTYDVIVPTGVFREQVVAPDGLENISIIAPVVRPRQATSSGVPTGGGCSWLSPTSPTATTPLLEIVRPGWYLANIQMSPVANSACVRLTTSAVDDLDAAGHTVFDNMYFSGGASGAIGIEDNGGSGFVQIGNSRFFGLGGSAILSLNTANAVPLMWEILNNTFAQNTNDVKMSLSYSQIRLNRFMTAGSGATNKVISTTFISSQGGNNHILLNQFTNTEAEIAPGSGFTGAASDVWMNYVTDQAALAIGQPA